MRHWTRAILVLVPVLATLLSAEPAAAQIGDCSETCTWSSDCSLDCVDGILLNTCGGYGVCSDPPEEPSCTLDTCTLGGCSRPAGGSDADCDSIPDALEYDLAHRFFPDIRVQSTDLNEVYLRRGWAIPYTVQPLAPRSGNVCSQAYECLEIRYGIAYVEDTGYNGHRGDSEFYAALVRRTTGWVSASVDAGAWVMIRDFTAAHWRAPVVDSSFFGAYGECLPSCSQWNDYELQCNYFSHCVWFPGRCQGDFDCPNHTSQSCQSVPGCYWDDFYSRCIDLYTGGTCTKHTAYSCSLQNQYWSCQYIASVCASKVGCYSSTPLTGPRTVYAAKGKHGLYHSVNECESGGFFGLDSCPESNPTYSMRSSKAGRLQNVGWEDTNCVQRDIHIQHPNACQLYNVWGGLDFADSSSYESHFRYLLEWWLP